MNNTFRVIFKNSYLYLLYRNLLLVKPFSFEIVTDRKKILLTLDFLWVGDSLIDFYIYRKTVTNSLKSCKKENVRLSWGFGIRGLDRGIKPGRHYNC